MNYPGNFLFLIVKSSTWDQFLKEKSMYDGFKIVTLSVISKAISRKFTLLRGAGGGLKKLLGFCLKLIFVLISLIYGRRTESSPAE